MDALTFVELAILMLCKNDQFVGKLMFYFAFIDTEWIRRFINDASPSSKSQTKCVFVVSVDHTTLLWTWCDSVHVPFR